MFSGLVMREWTEEMDKPKLAFLFTRNNSTKKESLDNDNGPLRISVVISLWIALVVLRP